MFEKLCTDLDIPIPSITIGTECTLHELGDHYCRERGVFLSTLEDPHNILHEWFHYIIDLARQGTLTMIQEENIADWLSWPDRIDEWDGAKWQAIA